MSKIFDKLSKLAAQYRDPIQEVPWDEANPSRPWLPEKMVSLSGQEIWSSMDADTRQKIAKVEFARLCAAGLWLEGLLIHRVTHEGFVAANATETRIVLQEVREEAGHGLMFLEMIDRAGMSGVSLLGPTRLLTWVAKRLDPDSAAFWAMVYIGESVTDTFALKALRIADREDDPICPVSREVMELHHRDEARHMAAAKALIDTKLAKMGPLRRLAFRAVVRLLIGRFLDATLYPTAASLRAVGIDNPADVARAVRADPSWRQIARECAMPSMALIDGRLKSVDATPRPA